MTRILGVVAALFAVAVGTAGPVAAQPDPYVPIPPFWCPGNPHGAISGSGYGGYCEGKTFPDGTRLNTWRLGAFWQPIRCIIPDGTPNPPLAGPGGCGGFLD
ncbi:hypothetical protein [uncultured Mycolicibacterium sp.]|uniref:hypothetical protein n=1 Tax=uncultured Mycolicibacterium sp. TaxID=2320817 RepID=UPI00260DFDC1|nr:hypothetical protein [uncultured Mycolicibacterium sp.]